VDALSDDGEFGITLIAFVGSVFSPYYAFARRFAPAEPLNHCAMNVALYGGRAKHWSMTERGRSAVERTTNTLVIGPSRLDWDGQSLVVNINELCTPWPARIRGTVRIYPSVQTTKVFLLDSDGLHRWWPLAPDARVQVELSEPGVRWLGSGYFDINAGDAPLESGFSGWEWSRASVRGESIVFYDTMSRRGEVGSLGLKVDPTGNVTHIEPPERVKLPRTKWRILRSVRTDNDGRTQLDRTLEDTPFYARSLVSARLFGEQAKVMHESLSLERFRRPIIQAMLPFRMPRW
jgi:carotenoid 1,2-hydratase